MHGSIELAKELLKAEGWSKPRADGAWPLKTSGEKTAPDVATARSNNNVTRTFGTHQNNIHACPDAGVSAYGTDDATTTTGRDVRLVWTRR